MAKEDIPTFGEGVAPWLVQVYVEGKYRCDGTLVSPRWVLTHAACANEVLPQKFSVARLGMYWNMEPRFLSAPEQVSLQAELFCHFLSIEIRIFYLIRYQIDILQVVRIALSLQVPNSEIALLKLEKNVNLTEHVSTACLPSSEWIPVDTNCFIHGTHEKAFNYAIEMKSIGKCNQNGNSYDICTKQTKPTNECLNNWSGRVTILGC